MAAQPKKKLSRGRSGKRAFAKRYILPRLTLCPKCSSPKLSHRTCPNCGYYKENLVFEQKEATKVSKVSSQQKE
ncbi:MAG: 50S ribosomal protein L32 [Candidatus Woykebacteria bacterium RBG_16_44_10]|uniref:Large ribosomal subunit protein bL32 n=1 Tax=Candidatus Woykebacteria bacterium RBG_16_44_10 TaxID=1802597 RepID=A0A1G1WF88_9BACT|nr:MAG: 50S ribosomal protein L32 [Candidatus Woykebacteria bacterium RBG_16_44_10]